MQPSMKRYSRSLQRLRRRRWRRCFVIRTRTSCQNAWAKLLVRLHQDTIALALVLDPSSTACTRKGPRSESATNRTVLNSPSSPSLFRCSSPRLSQEVYWVGRVSPGTTLLGEKLKKKKDEDSDEDEDKEKEDKGPIMEVLVHRGTNGTPRTPAYVHV